MKRFWTVVGLALVGSGTWMMEIPAVSALCVLLIIVIAASFVLGK